MNLPKPESPILWRQVSALAGIQGAITLSWLIYGLYLPGLLQQVGLPPTLALPLLALENALAALMEPVMGGLSDRNQRWVGTRLPWIFAGVILSATLFIALPAIALFGSVAARPFLLGGLIAWSLAMTIFRGPMLCLLANYAFATQLPQAFSILTLVGGVVGALRPLASQTLLGLGSAIAFTAGSVVLLAAAAYLRSVHPPVVMAGVATPLPSRTLIFLLVVLFLLGFTVAWSFRGLMAGIFPPILQLQVPGVNLSFLMGVFSLLLAVFALPAGAIAPRIGNARLMILGLLGTAMLTILLGNLQGMGVVIVAIALVACLSPVINGTVPLALSLVPVQRGGLAVGMYFGGFSAAMGLFGAVFGDASAMPLVYQEMLTITLLLAAAGCVAASQLARQSG